MEVSTTQIMITSLPVAETQETRKPVVNAHKPSHEPVTYVQKLQELQPAKSQRGQYSIIVKISAQLLKKLTNLIPKKIRRP